MKSTILIDANIETIKVAVIEDDRPAEFHVSARDAKRLVGNIYKGKVVNVLPGMRAAFISYGAGKNGYLSAEDILVDSSELDPKAAREIQFPPLSSLKEGGAVMVQVVKDECGGKGARLSQNISLPGRFAVLLPTMDYVGISRKIDDEAVRLKLAKTVEKTDRKNCGVIIRTAAERAPASEILGEIKMLLGQWEGIRKAYEESGGKELIFSEGDLAYCAIRDLLHDGVQKVIINNADVYASLKDQMEAGVLRRYIEKLEFYPGKDELFGLYGADAQLERLLENRIELKNKAYLVFDKTEAMTVIDVNTGAFIGAESMEQTAFETNLIAAEEIARQLRLRNTGGIVIIDFIDMELEEHNNAVVDYLKICLRADRTKTQVFGMTSLGFVEMTRRKQSRDIHAFLTQKCPYCKGLGKVYSVSVIIDKIRAAIEKIMDDIDPNALVLTVNPVLADSVFDSRILSTLCETAWHGKRIYIVPDERVHMHSYRIHIEKNNIIDLPSRAMLLY